MPEMATAMLLELDLQLELGGFSIRALVSSQVAGYLQARSSHEGKRGGYIEGLYVQESHRRQGIATALLERAFEQFRQMRKRSAWLFVNPEDAPAMYLYDKLGFEEVETDSMFFCRMVKRL